MDKDVLIQVDHVSKKFCRDLKRSMFYGAADIVRDSIGVRGKSEQLRKKEFWALDDVSLQLKRGEALGIIGPNGSGKTTLLKMLNGIMLPDKGSITVRGRIGALIALGAGFHPQLTGRENVFINGAILGMRKKEIERKFDQIVEFSGIEDFLDTPVKHYSSGMFVRLGFSVAIHLDPDILLIDEVLAVGDVGFRARSYEAIKRLQKKGVSVILISHNLPAVYETCDRTMLLWKGTEQFIGDTGEAINMLNQEMFKAEELDTSSGSKFVNDPLLGEIELRGGADVKSVRLLDMEGNEQTTLCNGKRQMIEARVVFEEDTQDPCFGAFLWDNRGRIIHDSYTLRMGPKMGFFKAGKEYRVQLHMTPHLLSNTYNIGISLAADGLDHFFYARKVKALTMCVDSQSRSDGIVDMDAEIKVVE